MMINNLSGVKHLVQPNFWFGLRLYWIMVWFRLGDSSFFGYIYIYIYIYKVVGNYGY